MNTSTLVFIGGGNMAGALIGGLLKAGVPADSILVLEPSAAQRASLQQRFGVRILGEAGPDLRAAQGVVWAVKPQSFAEAAAACAPYLADALHLSIMAGVRCGAIARRSGARRIVRAMPNTPALIGQGIAGLYANAVCTPADRAEAERLLAPTGSLVWVEREAQLDAVTALSGSGPAYVFYLAEALTAAGVRLGLPADTAMRLALGTLSGAAALATQSPLSATQLREQVTSKGGTTAAALDTLTQHQVAQAFDAALQAAACRAAELGDLLD
ncbi:MAG: pyrroline-5-carboxylate reductase [Burkholderiales bacterium]|jgi:pyrroline-5-carboxylate reductase|nr:pyrroline-5-carboxylate reductase [Burkholderiales bacterium]